ncbi:hypothetical protein Tco_0291556 [Tanacetum coccineum]
MHDPLKWWLYDMCAVHHVSTEKGQDIFIPVEMDYPLTKGLATLMLCSGYSNKEKNVQKCSLLGVCVSEVDVLGMANIIGCGAANLPLTYLGVPVGGNMSRCHNWEAIVKKNSSKLSLWKARLVFVGGRISLIKPVLGNLPTYFMSLYLMSASIRSKLESLRNNFFNGSELGERKMVWVSWKTCLASKESGGLGIGSIYALNVGILFKWIWRFLHNHSDLCVRVIKGIYGRTGVGTRSIELVDIPCGSNKEPSERVISVTTLIRQWIVKKSIDVEERRHINEEYDSWSGMESQIQTAEDKVDTEKALDVVWFNTEALGQNPRGRIQASRSGNDAHC